MPSAYWLTTQSQVPTKGLHASRVSWFAGILICRVADLGWRLGRVYFLAFLNPLSGTTGPGPYRQVGQPCHGRGASDGVRLIYRSRM